MFSSIQERTFLGSSSTSNPTSLALAGSPLKNTACIKAYMSSEESRLERSDAISTVTWSTPRANDSRLRTAARMSPMAFSEIISIAVGSTATPSLSAIFWSAFAIAGPLGLMNLI